MAGHSKWATIKRQKGAADAKRGQLFTKLGHAIAIAARSGDDPDTNYTLRLAIDKAKASNMPMANIQRSIDRGSGKLGGASIEEMTFEAYGPEGIAVIIECATDNKNRTVAEVRTAVTKHGGTMADPGSLSFMFDRKGMIRVKKTGKDDDDQLSLIDAGAEDVFDEEDMWAVHTEPKQLHAVRQSIEEKKLEVESAELAYVPKDTIAIPKSESDKVLKFMEAVEDVDDVANTYANFDIAD